MSKKTKRIEISNEALIKETAPKELLLVDCLNNYLNSLKASNKSEATIVAYKKDLEQFILSQKLSKKTIDKVTRADINDFRDKLEQNVGCAISTVKRKLNSISAFFTYCVNRGWINTNPCYKQLIGRIKKDTIKFLEENELIKLINMPDKEIDDNWLRNKTLLHLIAFTGARRSEALDMKWNQIDLYKEKLVIYHKKSNLKTEFDIHDSLLELLKQLFYIESPNQDDYVFVSEKGNRLSNTAYTQMFTRYVEMSGIEKDFVITGHVLRHTFCVYLINNGVPIAKVSKLMGHTDISTTVEFYYQVKRSFDQSDKDILKGMYSNGRTEGKIA